jgi:Peptidase inhibitor family I36
MNRYITVGCFVALHSLAAGIAHAQWGPPRAGACFYGDANFEGSSFCANVGETLRQLPAGAEGQVSSIEVFGNASVVVFTGRNLQGLRSKSTRA